MNIESSFLGARRIGLTFQWVLYLILVGALLSGMILANAIWQQKNTVQREVEQRGLLLGESLASACALRYLLGDLEAIRYILARSQNIQDVASLALTDSAGRVEVRTGSEEGLSIPGIQSVARPRAQRRDDVIEVVTPVQIERPEGMEPFPDSARAVPDNNLLGYIVVRLSLQRAHHSLAALIFRSVAATLAIIGAGGALFFLILRRTLLHPLRRLADAMAVVQQGNLETRLEEAERTDEIGTLARAFNEMTHDLKFAEEALRSANQMLEKRVVERTWELQRALQELKETQDKVVRSEKLAAIGQLASSVGHELRNPLGAIRNAVYYVRDALKDLSAAREDPTLIEFLDVADKEIKAATTIIGDLLDFARVGKLFLQKTDLNDLLGSIKSVIQVPANVRYQEHYAPHLPVLDVDPQRMRQVFINLANNAIQAMPEGGELRVETALENGTADPCVRVSFQDTGVGMAPETLRRIFEPLFTTKAKGTGLGLAVCQGIVEGHGGKILVESEPRRGSRFIVKLPLGKERHDS